jgi:hypothetical protein
MMLTLYERLDSLGNEKAAAKTNGIEELQNPTTEATTEARIERCSILRRSSALNDIITMERQLQGLQDDLVLVVECFWKRRNNERRLPHIGQYLFSETDVIISFSFSASHLLHHVTNDSHQMIWRCGQSTE